MNRRSVIRAGVTLSGMALTPWSMLASAAAESPLIYLSPLKRNGELSRELGTLEESREEKTREHHALKDLTIECFKRCCETYDFDAGIAMRLPCLILAGHSMSPGTRTPPSWMLRFWPRRPPVVPRE